MNDDDDDEDGDGNGIDIGDDNDHGNYDDYDDARAWKSTHREPDEVIAGDERFCRPTRREPFGSCNGEERARAVQHEPRLRCHTCEVHGPSEEGAVGDDEITRSART